MRVAFLGLRSPWGVEGGVEASVAELAPRLAAAGVEVTVYCRDRYNPHGNCVRAGVRLVDAPTIYSRSAEAFVHTALVAPRAAMHHDVVHLHACGPALFTPIPLALGRKSVVTIHGKDWDRDKWGGIAKAVLRAGGWTAANTAAEVIAVSQSLADDIRALGPAPVTYIPNGTADHEPVAWDASIFPMLRPRRYMLFVGRLVPEKGLDHLLRAVANARIETPVVITGGSSYTPAYVSRLHRDAPPGIVFTGPRFGLEKRMLLSHARAFVFPSRMEGLPLALLEALAAGLPVVASDIAPNQEVLGGLPGWRLPPDDVQAWTRALREIDDADPAFLQAMGAPGVARVRTEFGWEAVVRRTLDVYKRAVGERAGSAEACA